MRVELALIGGIVCFCCWCAYILINMNSTVSIPPTAAQVPQQHQQQHHPYQTSQPFQTNTNNNNNNNYNPNHRQPPYGNLASSAPMAEPFAATTAAAVAPEMAQPSLSDPATAVGHNFGGPASQQMGAKQPEVAPHTPLNGYYAQGKLTGAYLAPPSSVGGSYAVTSSPQDQAWQHPQASSSLGIAASNYPHYANGDLTSSKNYHRLRPFEPGGGSSSSYGNYYYPHDNRWQGEPVNQIRTSRRSPDGHRHNDDYGSEAAPSTVQSGYEPEGPEAEIRNQPAPPEEEGEAEQEDEQEADQPQQEEPEGDGSSHETIGARSYSENQMEANERDRFGRPIKVHYNHLINGRPVPLAASHHSVTDFDSVVNELDPDQQQQPRQGDQDDDESGQDDYDESIPASSQSMQRGESRLTGSASGKPPSMPRAKRREVASGNGSRGRHSRVVGRRGGSQLKHDKAIAIMPRDSHQHRLSESLSAQQWDDDAASLPSSSSSSSSKESKPPKRGQPLIKVSAGPEPSEAIETTTEASTTPEEFVNDEELQPDDVVTSDLFEGTDKFPFLDSDSDSRRRRRRRQVAGEDSKDESIPQHDRLARLHPDPHGDDLSLVYDSNRTRDAADTLNSLEDLNIRVMSNPSPSGGDSTAVASAGGQLQQQQSSVPAPLPAPPWPPSSASSTYPIGQQQQQSDPSGPQPVDRYRASSMQNGHSGGHQLSLPPSTAALAHHPYPARSPTYSTIRDIDYYPSLAGSGGGSGSSSSHKPRRKKMKRSKVQGSSKDEMMKYKRAKALKSKKFTKYNKAGMKKAKRKAKNKFSKSSKQFKGSTRGKRGKQGHGHRGSKKGSLYHKDKGYKKRGFKKVYKKMEAGDKKTYFDEFRDKDHNKKYKNSKDKYHYSHNKNWAGNDMKKYKDLNALSFKDKKMGSGGLREKSKSNFKHDYKYKDAHSSKSSKKKKKRKKKIE